MKKTTTTYKNVSLNEKEVRELLSGITHIGKDDKIIIGHDNYDKKEMLYITIISEGL